jgi:Tfp pilus assembly protein PilO
MNKNFLYAALLVGLGGWYAYDTYYPEFVRWETDIATLQQDIAQARQTAPKLAELSQEEAELKRRLRSSLEKLPSGAELADLLVMVLPIYEKVGIASNRIVTKNIGAATEKIIYRVHPIQISGIKEVSMQTIVRLLFELRSFHRIVNVASFNMTRSSPDEYEIGFSLETYSYIESEGEDLGLDEAEDTGAVAAEVTVPITETEAEPGAETTVVSSETDTSGAAPVPDASAAGTETGGVPAGDTSSGGGALAAPAPAASTTSTDPAGAGGR